MQSIALTYHDTLELSEQCLPFLERIVTILCIDDFGSHVSKLIL